MELLLTPEDLARLAASALEGRAEVRDVSCDADTVTVRVVVGFFPASLEFREFRLLPGAIQLRVGGAVASRLLNLFRARLEAARIEVEGNLLRLPLPPALTRALDLTGLEVTATGLLLRGHCQGLPVSVPAAEKPNRGARGSTTTGH
jgi:hypothetical protein